MGETPSVMSALIQQITSLLSSVTGWLTSILSWAVAEPLILFFIALGLVGVMIRWARVVVNFIRGQFTGLQVPAFPLGSPDPVSKNGIMFESILNFIFEAIKIYVNNDIYLYFLAMFTFIFLIVIIKKIMRSFL